MEQQAKEFGVVSVEFTLTRSMIYSALERTDKMSGRTTKTTVYLIVLAVLAVLNGVKLVGGIQMGNVFLALACVLVIGLVIFFSRTRNDRITQALYADGAAYKITFTGQDMRITLPGERRTVDFADEVTVYAFPDCYTITYRDNRFFLFPLEPLSDPQRKLLEIKLSQGLSGKFHRWEEPKKRKSK